VILYKISRIISGFSIQIVIAEFYKAKISITTMEVPRSDPPDKASDRPLMRPVTVALSSRPDPVMYAEGRGPHA